MNYTTLVNKEVLDRVVAALAGRNVEAIVVENGTEALVKIKEFIQMFLDQTAPVLPHLMCSNFRCTWTYSE